MLGIVTVKLSLTACCSVEVMFSIGRHDIEMCSKCLVGCSEVEYSTCKILCSYAK